MEIQITLPLFFQIVGFITVFFISSIIFLHCHFHLKRHPIKLSSQSYIIIVGACRGIGKQIALQLSKKYNPKLLLVDIRYDQFEKVSQQIKKVSQFTKVQCFQGNMAKKQSIQKLIKYINQKNQRIDMFIYNSGILIPKLCWEQNDQQSSDIFNINYFAPTKIFKEIMKQLQGGIYCVTSSLGVQMPVAKTSLYVASKSALFSYMKCLRNQLKIKKTPISICIALPGSTNTNMTKGLELPKGLQKVLPSMSVQYVANQMINGYINKKQNIYIKPRQGFFFKLLNFLPSQVLSYDEPPYLTKSFDKFIQRHQNQFKNDKEKYY